MAREIKNITTKEGKANEGRFIVVKYRHHNIWEDVGSWKEKESMIPIDKNEIMVATNDEFVTVQDTVKFRDPEYRGNAQRKIYLNSHLPA